MVSSSRAFNLMLSICLIVAAYGLFKLYRMEDYDLSVMESIEQLNTMQIDETADSVSLRYPAQQERFFAPINDKNLFHPDRAPVIFTPLPSFESLPEEPIMEDAPASMVLVGIIRSGDLQVALISDPSINNGVTQHYTIDDRVSRFTIVAILSDRVIFTSDSDTEVVLRLHKAAIKSQNPVTNQPDRNPLDETIAPEQDRDRRSAGAHERSATMPQTSGDEAPFPESGQQ